MQNNVYKKQKIAVNINSKLVSKECFLKRIFNQANNKKVKFRQFLYFYTITKIYSRLLY